MSKFLKIVRYFFAIIFIFFLLLLFFIGIPLTATTQTFVNRDNVKSILNNSGIYDNFIDIFIEQSQNIESSSESEIVTLLQEDTEFKVNLKTVFSSDEIQPKVESIIDGFYDWLEGKTSQPQFEVSFIEDEDTFKNLFTSVMMLRMEGLPTCSESVESIPTDMMNIECIPAGTNFNNLETYFEEALDSGDMDMTEILDSFTFNSDQLNISYNTSLLVQNIFKVVKVLPILLSVVIFLLTLFILLLIPSVKGSFITTSIIYLLTGLFFILLGSVRNVDEILNASMSASIDISQLQSAELMANLFLPIFQLILHRIFQYSLVLLGTGGVLLIIGLIINKKKKEDINTQEVTTNEEITESQSQDTI